jgi:hypothetical protein
MPVCGMTCDVMERSAKKRISSFVHAVTDEIHIQFILAEDFCMTIATERYKCWRNEGRHLTALT